MSSVSQKPVQNKNHLSEPIYIPFDVHSQKSSVDSGNGVSDSIEEIRIKNNASVGNPEVDYFRDSQIDRRRVRRIIGNVSKFTKYIKKHLYISLPMIPSLVSFLITTLLVTLQTNSYKYDFLIFYYIVLLVPFLLPITFFMYLYVLIILQNYIAVFIPLLLTSTLSSLLCLGVVINIYFFMAISTSFFILTIIFCHNQLIKSTAAKWLTFLKGPLKIIYLLDVIIFKRFQTLMFLASFSVMLLGVSCVNISVYRCGRSTNEWSLFCMEFSFFIAFCSVVQIMEVLYIFVSLFFSIYVRRAYYIVSESIVMQSNRRLHSRYVPEDVTKQGDSFSTLNEPDRTEIVEYSFSEVERYFKKEGVFMNVFITPILSIQALSRIFGAGIEQYFINITSVVFFPLSLLVDTVNPFSLIHVGLENCSLNDASHRVTELLLSAGLGGVSHFYMLDQLLGVPLFFFNVLIAALFYSNLSFAMEGREGSRASSAGIFLAFLFGLQISVSFLVSAVSSVAKSLLVLYVTDKNTIKNMIPNYEEAEAVVEDLKDE